MLVIFFIEHRKVLRIVPQTTQDLEDLRSLETDYGLEVWKHSCQFFYIKLLAFQICAAATYI